MDYKLAEKAGTVTVSLSGQLNFASNEQFHGLLEKLAEVSCRRVVFDLSGLGHIDSVGLGLLYIAQEDVAATGAKLVLAAPQPEVFRLLELTEADKTFEIVR